MLVSAAVCKAVERAFVSAGHLLMSPDFRQPLAVARTNLETLKVPLLLSANPRGATEAYIFLPILSCHIPHTVIR